MGLKLNDQSDPFALADFNANWSLLDASPGTFICTSTSRPNWGAAQTGRMIFMRDLKQHSFWDGTNWNDLRNAVPVFSGGTYLNTTINPGASPTFNVLTFTTPRPSALAIIATGTYTYPNNKSQDAQQAINFDGVKQMMGGYQEQIRFAGDSGDNGANSGANATSMAVIPSVATGQHKIGIQVAVQNAHKTAVTVVGVKVLAFIALYNTGNAL